MGLLSALMSIFLFRFLVSEAHDGEGGLSGCGFFYLTRPDLDQIASQA